MDWMLGDHQHDADGLEICLIFWSQCCSHFVLFPDGSLNKLCVLSVFDGTGSSAVRWRRNGCAVAQLIRQMLISKR